MKKAPCLTAVQSNRQRADHNSHYNGEGTGIIFFPSKFSLSVKQKKCAARSHAPKNAGSLLRHKFSNPHEYAKIEPTFLPNDKNAHSCGLPINLCRNVSVSCSFDKYKSNPEFASFLNLTPQKHISPAVMDSKNSPLLRGFLSACPELVYNY